MFAYLTGQFSQPCFFAQIVHAAETTGTTLFGLRFYGKFLAPHTDRGFVTSFPFIILTGDPYDGSPCSLQIPNIYLRRQGPFASRGWSFPGPAVQAL